MHGTIVRKLYVFNILAERIQPKLGQQAALYTMFTGWLGAL
jgi:hypothetical protein